MLTQKPPTFRLFLKVQSNRNPVFGAIVLCSSLAIIVVCMARNSSTNDASSAMMWPPEYETNKETGMSYILFRPLTWSPESATTFPLLLFLHGAGESGSNTAELLSEGASGCPPVELAAGRADSLLSEKFIVVAPQTDRGYNIYTFLNILIFSGWGWSLW